MMYTISAILVFALLTVISAVEYSRFGRDTGISRRIAFTDAAIGILGLIAVLISYLLISSMISSCSDGDFASWARDMLDGWYSVTFTASGVLFAVNLLAGVFACFDKKQQERTSVLLRTAVLIVSPAVPLILAPFYGFMTENDTLPLYTAILVSGIGTALVFRLVPFAVYLVKKGKKSR